MEAETSTTLTLFGGFRLTIAAAPVSLASKKCKALLAYLALHAGVPQPRAMLASLLWPESAEPQARDSLRQSLVQLRRALGSHALATEPEAVGLARGALTVDVAAFERHLAGGPREWDKAVALYAGDLLEGFEVRAPAFEDWLAAERQRLRERMLDALHRLFVHHREAGAVERALAAGARLVALDPLQEACHRGLMQLFLQHGRPASALRQFRLCAEALKRELGVEPDAETSALYRRILDQRRRRGPVLPPTPSLPAAPGPMISPRESGARKYATVLSASLQLGSQSAPHRDPEDLEEWARPARAAIEAAALRHGGTIASLTSLGATIIFGAPVAQEDHALRAAWAALDTEAALASDAVTIGFGIDSGEVVVRRRADDSAEIVGLPLRTARLLAENGPDSGIRLTGRAAASVRAHVALAKLGEATLSGETMPVLRLLGREAGHGAGQAARDQVPFVGRTAELDTLHRMRARAATGIGQVVALTGEAGIGKSRLAEEFAAGARADGWQVLTARGVPEGAGVAFGPFVELVRGYFDLGDQDSPETARDKVARRLAALAPGLRSLLPALYALLALPTEDEAWERVGSLQRTRQIRLALRAVLAAESARRPLLLIVEDAHWLDAERADVLDSLIDGLSASHCLILATYRPELQDRWERRGQVTRLSLAPLAWEDAAAFLDLVMGSDGELQSIKRDLARRCGGNPFFLEETVRMLAETGVLTGRPGAYRPTGAPLPQAVPDTVRAVLSARIDRLPRDQRQLLHLAAVIGVTVPHTVIAAIAPWPEEELFLHLGELQAAGLIYESRLLPDAQYSFRHMLIREIAYHGLLREDRRAIHLAVARAIESLYGERREELGEALAWHYEAAGSAEDAARCYLEAARSIKERFVLTRAVRLCHAALACAGRAERADAERREASVLLGDLASTLGRQGEAEAWYAKALDLPSGAGQRRAVENKRQHPGIAFRNGARLAYSLCGAGQRTVLLINPLIYGPALFQPVVETLCQKFRVVSVAPRGTGASDAVLRPYRTRERAEDVRAVIEAVGGPVIGLGVSRGSSLLLWLAAHYPDLIDSLVLVGTPVDDCGPASLFPRAAEVQRPIFEALERGDHDAAVTAFCHTLFSEPDVEDLVAMHIRYVLELPRDTFLAFFDPDPDVDVRPLLPKIRAPTLLAHGTEDKRVPIAAGRYVADHIAGARFHAFAGKGHLPVYSAAKEFTEVVDDFLTS